MQDEPKIEVSVNIVPAIGFYQIKDFVSDYGCLTKFYFSPHEKDTAIIARTPFVDDDDTFKTDINNIIILN